MFGGDPRHFGICPLMQTLGAGRGWGLDNSSGLPKLSEELQPEKSSCSQIVVTIAGTVEIHSTSGHQEEWQEIRRHSCWHFLANEGHMSDERAAAGKAETTLAAQQCRRSALKREGGKGVGNFLKESNDRASRGQKMFAD